MGTNMFSKLAIPAALTTVLVLPVSANAQFYGPGRWCAVVNNATGNMTWDCSYASIEQCRPNVLGGSRGFCNPNPSFARGDTASLSPFDGAYVTKYAWKIKPNALEGEIVRAIVNGHIFD